MITNPANQSHHTPTIQGWITPPRNLHHGLASEGHASAVNVLRMVNTRHQHQASEPVPFKATPTLRSIKTSRAYTGCRPGLCESRPNCADTACQGHPLQMVQGEPDDGFDVPASERDPVLALKFWVSYIAFIVVSISGAVYWFTR